MAQATADVKGGFFAQYSATLSQTGSRGAAARLAALALGRKGAQALRELMKELNGAAAGQPAVSGQYRIEANTELGGVRDVEFETFINRNTAAADETLIDQDVLALSSQTHDPTPVENGNGNPLNSPGLF
jgi:hypothetical protein